MSMHPKIGAVSYLNARPLTLALDQGLGNLAPVLYDVPSKLAEHLDQKTIDIALLPVAALVGRPELELIPGIAIGCDGPVQSVVMHHKSSLKETTKLYLDPESQTSNLLAQILLRTFFNCSDFEVDKGQSPTELAAGEACVRIGDKVLDQPAPSGSQTLDLGEAWRRFTGLPFVFATWAGRPESIDRDTYQALHIARKEGTRQIAWIVADAVDTWDAERARSGRERSERTRELQTYLTESLSYRLGRREIDGLQTFFLLAHQEGLIETLPKIKLAFGQDSACHKPTRYLEIKR